MILPDFQTGRNRESQKGHTQDSMLSSGAPHKKSMSQVGSWSLVEGCLNLILDFTLAISESKLQPTVTILLSYVYCDATQCFLQLPLLVGIIWEITKKDHVANMRIFTINI